MWGKIVHSPAFWGSAFKSYLINLAFGVSINVALNWGKPTIPFLTHFHGDMALAFLNSAMFCGLFTPLFSSCFIGNMVASGKVQPPDLEDVAKSRVRCVLLGRCLVIRCLVLALVDIIIFGGITVATGSLLCGRGSFTLGPMSPAEGSSLFADDTCELPVYAFLILQILWSVPVQVATSLPNFVAVAHLARERFPQAGSRLQLDLSV